MQCLIHIRRSRARWLRKEPFLKLGGSALSLHHSWDGLVQNVINIFCTFLWRDFLCPEFLDAVHQLLFVAWLHFGLQKELQLVPLILDRVEVRTFRRRFPPVDAVLFKGGLCSFRGMLWVIVLHKTMIGQFLSRVVSRILQKRAASMMPSKMQIFVAPCLLIPPQT